MTGWQTGEWHFPQNGECHRTLVLHSSDHQPSWSWHCVMETRSSLIHSRRWSNEQKISCWICETHVFLVKSCSRSWSFGMKKRTTSELCVTFGSQLRSSVQYLSRNFICLTDFLDPFCWRLLLLAFPETRTSLLQLKRRSSFSRKSMQHYFDFKKPFTVCLWLQTALRCFLIIYIDESAN